MKKIIFKGIIVLIAWSVVGFIQKTWFPLFIADSTTLQLENSDTAYATWKGIQALLDWVWVLYLLPLLLFYPEFKNTVVNKENENEEK